MDIPFVDLAAQYRSLKPDIDAAILRVMESGRFVGGDEVSSFEAEFADYIGVNHCIGVNSGTDALILGIRALGFSPGDEVIVPANTFIATALSVSENGLTPVFVDCDDSYGMSLTDLERKITKKTHAVIAVHLYGRPDDIGGIRAVILKSGRKIHLIEDACQAHGAEYRGDRVGSFGSFAAFSFYPGKNLGAYGDAGAVVTNDPDLAKRVRLLHEYGSPKKYVHDTSGINSRMDELQAAVLRIKLPHLVAWNIRRQDIAVRYRTALVDTGIGLPPEDGERESVYHLFPVLCPDRDGLQAYLEKRRIRTLIHYPVPLHLQLAYASLGYKRGEFPVAESQAAKLLSLPIFPEMTDEQIRAVTGAVLEFGT
jgi:dTDP-4-amino-4,6-dideoxygalactose transaminase